MSCLQIHDANEAVLNHFNRNHHQRRRHHQSLSQILDSLPQLVESDDDVSETGLDSAAEGVDLLERRSFVMDLFHQRVEQSQVRPLDAECAGSRSDSCSGIVERNRDMRELDFDLELDSCNGFDGISCLGGMMESGDVIVADSDDDVAEKEKEIWGIDLNEEDVYANDDDDDDDDSVTIPLCWDSLQLEDLGVNNNEEEEEEEFEWEQVDDEREDDNNSVSVSVSATIPLEDLTIGERRGYLGWEVLLNSRSLEFNLDDADSNMELLYFGGDQQEDDEEDYLQTTEYEVLFEADISSCIGKPPASKSFIKNLKVSLLTKEDLTENDGHAMCCAVCRQEMSVGKEVAELPCHHKYHCECIVPWLGIRNTCPVCRFELPSDET